jgi:hypothetical protein
MRIGSLSFRTVVSLVVLSAVTMASPMFAQGKVRGMVRLGADFGGEKVLQFQYSDGSTPDVVAGAGLLISAGAAIQAFKVGGHEVDAQVNAGMKYRTIPPASNQSATWNRFPVEALLVYQTPVGLRIGGGAAVHLGNVFEASGAALNSRLEFKNNPGYLLQTEYAFRRWSFDLRYTMMKYEIESGGSGTVDANSFGAGFSYVFGR